jgi:lysozyme
MLPIKQVEQVHKQQWQQQQSQPPKKISKKEKRRLELIKNSLMRRLIQKSEGFSPVPYKDPAGYLTVGYGHRIVDPQLWKKFAGKDGRLSLDEAESLFKHDVAKHQAWKNKVPNVTPEQEVALTSLEYNLGYGESGKPLIDRVTELLAEGKAKEAADFIRTLDSAKGKQLPGLTARRAEEADLVAGNITAEEMLKKLDEQKKKTPSNFKEELVASEPDFDDTLAGQKLYGKGKFGLLGDK